MRTAVLRLCAALALLQFVGALPTAGCHWGLPGPTDVRQLRCVSRHVSDAADCTVESEDGAVRR